MLIFLHGISIYFSLIISIGPQNTELIRLGILRNHVFVFATISIICDIVLIIVGAFGVANFIAINALLTKIFLIIAIIVLLYLSFYKYRQIFSNHNILLNDIQTKCSNKQKIIISGFMYSLLNPLGLLETIIILGSVSNGYISNIDKMIFCFGAIITTIIWFYGVSYGATKLYKIFQNNRNQNILNFSMATLLFCIALSLVYKIL